MRQELFCLHPNIVRSSLKNLSEADIEKVKIPQLLLEAEHDWDIKRMKDSPIFADLLCKYHKDLERINGKHPFSWAIAEIYKFWPQIIDFLSSNLQTHAQLSFLKEFMLDLFSSYEYQLLQCDMIDYLKLDHPISFLCEVTCDILAILPKIPSSSYFATSQKLIKVGIALEGFDFMILLDQIISRFEMGYPIKELSTILLHYDYHNMPCKFELALIFSCAYILSKSLDKVLCQSWITILDASVSRLNNLNSLNNYLNAVKRIILWPLIKVKTEKTCKEEIVKSLIEWCHDGIGQKFEAKISLDNFYYDLHDFGGVLFHFIGPVLQLHAANNINLKAFYFPENQDLSIMILSSLTLHAQEEVRFSALELLATSGPYSMAKLSYFLYSCSLLCQETQSYLFSHIIPLFVTKSQDPFIVISGVNSVFLLDDTASRILALYNIWNRYPRIWPKLRSVLGETMQKWKLALIKDEKIEKALSWTIRKCCNHSTKNIEDLMALIMNGLSSRYFSDESYVNLLHGLNECVKENVLDLRAVWNVTLQPFLDQLNNEIPDKIHYEIIRFYGLVGRYPDNSETFQEFRNEILHNKLLSNQQNTNLEIQAITSESLSKFPVDIILNILIPLSSYQFSRKDSQLMEILISSESSCMRRGLFKGNQATDIGDLSEDEKRLHSFKKSVLNSVRDEIDAGRMKSTRKTALAFLSVVDCPFANVKNLLSIKEISAAVKNMNIDSIWQLWYLSEYLESFWLKYLRMVYENLDYEKHSEKVAEIESIISHTYSITMNDSFPNSSSPQTTSNLLLCIGSLITAACKLGIANAYNLNIMFFDTLSKDLKDHSSKIIPEDFNASRNLQGTALVVLSDLSSTFLSHDINRKVDFIQSILIIDESPHFKRSVVYYLLPKVLAEIAELQGLNIGLKDLWESVIMKLKKNANDTSNVLMPFLTSFQTFVHPGLIDESIIPQIAEIAKQIKYGEFILQIRARSLTAEKMQEYIKQHVAEKDSDEYIYLMWICITQCSSLEFFEEICGMLQDTLRSDGSSAERITVLISVAVSLNGHPLFTSRMNLTFCQIIVELTSRAGDPKLLRVACWSLAKLLISASPKILYLGNESLVEPKNFSRLSASESMIRLAFDRLLAAESSDDLIFLEPLLNVNVPLPRVNWSKLLQNITDLLPDSRGLALKFAAKHSFISESSSLASYFSNNIMSSGRDSLSFLTSIEGIGNILLLAGFSKSQDFSFSPLISNSECIETVKYIFGRAFIDGSLTDRIELSRSLRNCFIDWKYPDVLGGELMRQIATLFRDWLVTCSPNPSEDEIIIIRNLSALCSAEESAAMRNGELTASWIWHSFSLPITTNTVVSLLQESVISQSYDILFAASSALKTFLTSQNKGHLEQYLITLLDALICTPDGQNHAVMNMWNYGLLNVLHSLLNYPKYSVEYEEILGWGSDESLFLKEEILWDLSTEIDSLSSEIKSKFCNRIKTINGAHESLKNETRRILSRIG